jgi:hypothetical protein
MWEGICKKAGKEWDKKDKCCAGEMLLEDEMKKQQCNFKCLLSCQPRGHPAMTSLLGCDWLP